MRGKEALEAEHTILKAFLNDEIQKAMVEWRSRDALVFSSDRIKSAAKLNTYIQVAQEMGFGLSLQVDDWRIVGGAKPLLSPEAGKFIRLGTRESLIIDIQSKEERKKQHSSFLRVEVKPKWLSLVSRHGSEATFLRNHIISMEVR